MRLNSLLHIAKPLATIAIAICVIATLLNAPAKAAIQEHGFSFKLTEKEPVLTNPGSISAKMDAMWDTSAQRIMARNMPFFEITNLAKSTANLLELDITIGDTRFNFSDQYFGMLVRPGSTTPAGAIQSATTTDGDAMKIVFGNGGIAPGDSVIFQIDIDADHSNLFQMPDFRTVLFDMNGFNVYDNTIMKDTADNSVLTGLFVDPNDTSMTEIGSIVMEDYDVSVDDGALYYNQNRRAYGIMEGVPVFDGTFDPPIVIPEPSSVILLGLAGVALVARRFRSCAPNSCA